MGEATLFYHPFLRNHRNSSAVWASVPRQSFAEKPRQRKRRKRRGSDGVPWAQGRWEVHGSRDWWLIMVIDDWLFWWWLMIGNRWLIHDWWLVIDDHNRLFFHESSLATLDGFGFILRRFILRDIFFSGIVHIARHSSPADVSFAGRHFPLWRSIARFQSLSLGK